MYFRFLLNSMVLIPYLSNLCYAFQFLDCTHLNDCMFVHPHFGVRILTLLFKCSEEHLTSKHLSGTILQLILADTYSKIQPQHV